MNDLINRQVAIDALEWKWAGKAAIDAIKALPSAEPERQWISVSERFPEDAREVWVTIKGRDVIRCKKGETLEQAIERTSKDIWVTRGYWCEGEHSWNDPWFGCPLIVQPIAWMPMYEPEPYKGESEEEDGR